MGSQEEVATFLADCVRDALQSGFADWREIRDFLDERIASLPQADQRTVRSLFALMFADQDTHPRSRKLH